MKFFYYKDKKTDVAYRGYYPSTDINCPPFDYFRFGYAYNFANLFQDILKVKCPIPIHDDMVRDFILAKTDELIANQLATTKPNPIIHQLLLDNSLSYKDQNKLLKGLTLTGSDLLWMNKEAQDMGYLLDIYHEEKYPDIFKEKKFPSVFRKKEDDSIEKIGSTDMTDGEMRALLEQRKVIQARVYHKNSTWHCFYFTLKGLAGLESGLMGSKPHYHYLSDKAGIAWSDLVKRIKSCDMPSSKVHIVVDR